MTDFEEERQTLKASLAAAPLEVSPQTLRSGIEAYTEGLEWLLEGNDARVRAGLQHLLQGQRIEVHPEVEESEGFRLEADMLLFASPLSRPPNADETPEANPGRLVRLVAGACYARGLPVPLVLPVRGRVPLAA
jgi:hypothetical protein